MSDSHGIADEPYKDGGLSEHGIYQTLKTALYQYTIHLQHRPVPAGLEDTLLRTQGPDGGFHTGYDQARTYSGTLENTETTSIVIITLSSITLPLVPAWILITGIATLVAGTATILIVIVLDVKKTEKLVALYIRNRSIIQETLTLREKTIGPLSETYRQTSPSLSHAHH